MLVWGAVRVTKDLFAKTFLQQQNREEKCSKTTKDGKMKRKATVCEGKVGEGGEYATIWSEEGKKGKMQKNAQRKQMANDTSTHTVTNARSASRTWAWLAVTPPFGF